MNTIKGLKCRECDRKYKADPIYVCEFCFGPLEVEYDYKEIADSVSREKIMSGPPTLWRYRDLLPVEGTDYVDLGAGFTPLRRANRLAKLLGLKELYIKNDTTNPTWSFKDRVVTVALTRAKEFGFDTVACASTGNLANATAAHAAAYGLKCFIFIPYDLETGKVIGTQVYGPNLIKVEGHYDDVNRLCSEVAGKLKWAFVNVNVRPYYAEGSKTLAFETAEQLDWTSPDHVVVPMASGSLLTKIHKGFQEFWKAGLIEEPKTKMSGAQAAGCNPIATLVNEKAEFIIPQKPKTIAKSLAIGNPADGYYASRVIQETGGFAESVTDKEIVDAINLLAQTEGIFAETAGGVTIAALKNLVEHGKIRRDERTVAYVTGAGPKTLEAAKQTGERTFQIKPNLKAFESDVLRRVYRNFHI